MEVAVKGQHVDVGDALRAHISDKLEQVKAKYFNRVTDAAVVFSREGNYLFRANVAFHVGKDVKVQASADNADAYAAFDEAAAKVAKQLSRYKNRLRSHHAKLESLPDSEFLSARDYVLKPSEAEDETLAEGQAHEEPVVVAEMTTNIQTMTVSEAVMRLDLSDQNALLFRNAGNNNLNLVYRRSDGNIGWVDPQQQEKAASSKAA